MLPNLLVKEGSAFLDNEFSFQFFVQHEATLEASMTSTPKASQYAMAMVVGFCIALFVTYTVRQIKKCQDCKDAEGVTNESHYSLEKPQPQCSTSCTRALDHVDKADSGSFLLLIPVVCLVIFFIVFRAYKQNILEDDPDYRHFQGGIVLVTAGAMISLLDILTITIHSDSLGNMSQLISSIGVATGFAILLWALFAVQSGYQYMSTTAKCFVALAALVMVSMILPNVYYVFKKLGHSNTLSIIATDQLDEQQQTRTSRSHLHLLSRPDCVVLC
jgi:predicted histidine transporter YuiF (NhaC family)